MADVRGATGAATTGNFGGIGTPTPSTPLYVDLATGDLYVILAGDVIVQVGGVSANANTIITGQAFGKHLVPLVVDVGDANTQLAGRIFNHFVASPATPLEDFSVHASNAYFEKKPAAPVPDVQDANVHLANRVFDRMTGDSAVLGSANDMIKILAFSPRPLPAMWR